MYNIFGELIYSGYSNTDSKAINVRNFAKGMYIVQIDNGIERVNQKIIVE